jgi:hypothetical protein
MPILPTPLFPFSYEIGPTDRLWFLNGTKEEDMRQNGGFHGTARLLRSEERSQWLDKLWVSREEEN